MNESTELQAMLNNCSDEERAVLEVAIGAVLGVMRDPVRLIKHAPFDFQQESFPQHMAAAAGHAISAQRFQTQWKFCVNEPDDEARRHAVRALTRVAMGLRLLDYQDKLLDGCWEEGDPF